jgi:hypothetical protein
MKELINISGLLEYIEDMKSEIFTLKSRVRELENSQKTPLLVNAKNLAIILGVSQGAIANRKRNGHFSTVKIGETDYFNLHELDTPENVDWLNNVKSRRGRPSAKKIKSFEQLLDKGKMQKVKSKILAKEIKMIEN